MKSIVLPVWDKKLFITIFRLDYSLNYLLLFPRLSGASPTLRVIEVWEGWGGVLGQPCEAHCAQCMCTPCDMYHKCEVPNWETPRDPEHECASVVWSLMNIWRPAATHATGTSLWAAWLSWLWTSWLTSPNSSPMKMTPLVCMFATCQLVLWTYKFLKKRIIKNKKEKYKNN